MIKKGKNTLLGQMFFFVLAAAALMSAAFFMTFQYIRETAAEHTLQVNEKMLVQIEGKAAEFCSSMEHIATSLAYLPTTGSYFQMDVRQRLLAAADMDAVFSNIMLLEENIAGISLYDAKLAQIATTGADTGTRSPQLSLYQKMTFSGLFTIGTDDRNYYLIYYPVFDLENPQYGTQLGMCVFLMKTDYFQDILAEAEITKDAQVYLTDAKERIIASNVRPELSYMVTKLRRQSEGYYVQTHPLAVEGWNIVNRIPKRELYREQDGRMGVLFAAYLTAIGMDILIICFFYRRMIAPVERVDAFIKRLAARPDERMRAEREDEIATVINSLNQMMDDIQHKNRQVQASQKKIYEEQLARKELQVMAYRNQINPHFLYNTFECIRAMALYYEVEDIAEITMALSNVFRFAVKADNVVTVAEELSYIREYATIIDYRFMGKIDIYTEADPEMQEKRVMKLMLQPLVENAVFHGLEQKMDDGSVTVSIRKYGQNRMLVIVEDDGLGMDEETLWQVKQSLGRAEAETEPAEAETAAEGKKDTKKKGIGMANIYQRLRLFYGEDASFEIQSTRGTGTKITIIIPDDIKEGV